MKLKSDLLVALSVFGFEDPDPDFCEIAHNSSGIVINCKDELISGVKDVVPFIFNKGKQAGDLELWAKISRSAGRSLQ